MEKECRNIIAHELVHVKGKHSLDLLFFELMRIVGWFNPLVYVYQSRTAELHEFIADAQVAKHDKKEQYEFLLSQVFQTQNISFINQFAVTSLIKKRIAMLQKTKSRKVWQLKYLLLVPLLFGMLLYNSCQLDKEPSQEIGNIIEVADINQLTTNEEIQINTTLKDLSLSATEWKLRVVDSSDDEVLFVNEDIPENYIKGFFGERIKAKMILDSKITAEEFFGASTESVPFTLVEEIPVFPGCENEEDKRACFNTMIEKHISKHFRYPKEAEEKGIEGRVSVLFFIAKNGSIQGLRTRGPSKVLEEEAVRIIHLLPSMKPGRNQGKPVNVPFSVPIHFKLSTRSSDKTFNEDEIRNTESSIGSLFKDAYKNTIPFSSIDEAPSFTEIPSSLDSKESFHKRVLQHIRKNFRYPEEAQELGVQGRVVVLFTVGKDGEVKNIRTRGPHESLKTEAVRIISKLPKMNPPKHKGDLVDMVYFVPITFKLK